MVEREQDTGEISLSVRNEEDVFSPECLAWADSCIVSFPDDLDNSDWGTFTDALTEIIGIHPEIFVPSSTVKGNVLSSDEVMAETESTDTQSFEPKADSSNEEVSEIVSLLTFEPNPLKNSLQDHYFSESMAEKGTIPEPVDNPRIEEDGSESNNVEVEEEDERETVSPQVFKDDFMSTYTQDNVDDLNVLEDLVKVTPREIFKVWDLGTTGDDDDDNDEDGLGLQLKKALDDSSIVQSLPQPLNNEQVLAGKSNIDDLIAGISDLSLVDTFKL